MAITRISKGSKTGWMLRSIPYPTQGAFVHHLEAWWSYHPTRQEIGEVLNISPALLDTAVMTVGKLFTIEGRDYYLSTEQEGVRCQAQHDPQE